MNLLRAVLLSLVLSALLVDGATASTSAGLDPDFGNGGKTTVAVPEDQGGFARIEGLALGPEGRVYVLERSLLLAFEADGSPAIGFGEEGRLAVTPVGGEGEAEGLAVDSRGRVLIAGWVNLGEQERGGHPVRFAPVYAAYVIRLLPEGARDVTFGTGGEVQTAFGLPRPAARHGAKYGQPSAIASSIVVDSQDRPFIGGGYATAYEGCGESLVSGDPFVGRLTADGAVDSTFGKGGYALLGGHGEVSALARTPEGGPATLSYGISCGSRSEEEESRFTAFTEAGERSPSLDPRRPRFFMQRDMAVDPAGRILVVETPPPVSEGQSALDRLLPNGDLDPSFGKNGRVVLKGALGEVGAFTVDAQGRPILSSVRRRLELRRLDPNGTPDGSFGPGGRLYAQAAIASAVALDGDGRIYTAAVVYGKKPESGDGIQVARFLPGD